MKAVVVFGLIALMAATANGQAKLFRCGNTYTNDEAQALEQKCTPVVGGNVELRTPPRPQMRPATAAENAAFREAVKPGDYSSEGLVVEVKQPLVKVQTRGGERWFRLDELRAPSKPLKAAKK